jgi:hypothetical protein
LNEYATSNERVFAELGPKSSSEIYKPIDLRLSEQQILTIRRELQAYNNSRCPEKARGEGWTQFSRPSGICQGPPAIFCTSYPDALDGHVDKNAFSRTVAIASECIIPSLVASQARHEKLKAVVADKARTKYFRWLFFILFSLVAGGKVANATSRAIELDKRPEEAKRCLLKLLRPLWLGAKSGVGLAIKLCRASLGYAFIGLYRVARAILPGRSG